MNNSAATLGIEFAFRDMESCFDTLSCEMNRQRMLLTNSKRTSKKKEKKQLTI